MDSELSKRVLRRLRDQYVLFDINVIEQIEGNREESSMLVMVLLEGNNSIKLIPLTYFDCYKESLFTKEELDQPFADFLFSKRKIIDSTEKSIKDALEVQMTQVKQHIQKRGLGEIDIEISIVEEDYFYDNIETLSDLLYSFQADETLSIDVPTSLLGIPSPNQAAVQSFILSCLGLDNASSFMSIRGVGSLARLSSTVETLDSIGVLCMTSVQLQKFRASKLFSISTIRSLLASSRLDDSAIGTDAFFIAVESDNENGLAIYSLVGASNDTLYFEHSELLPFIHMETDTPACLALNNNSLGMDEVISTLMSFNYSAEPEICLDSVKRIPLNHESILFYSFVSNFAFDKMQSTFAINGYEGGEDPIRTVH